MGVRIVGSEIMAAKPSRHCSGTQRRTAAVTRKSTQAALLRNNTVRSCRDVIISVQSRMEKPNNNVAFKVRYNLEARKKFYQDQMGK